MPGGAEVYQVDSGNLQIWTRSIIQFVKIAADRVYTTQTEDASPQQGYNTFTVRELLLKCEPLPVRYEEVAELGAVIEIQFFWECYVKSSGGCKPEIRARRLDTTFDPDNIGFGYSYSEYIDKTTRLNNQVRGIRLFFRTAGVGKKVSVSATINKASLGAALFTIAAVIADLLLTKVFRLKEKYKARKFEKTPDFSEYMELVEEKKKFQVTTAAIDRKEAEVVAKEEAWLLSLDDDTA